MLFLFSHLEEEDLRKLELPAVQEIKDTNGDLPDIMSLDNGYMSGDNFEKLNKTDIDVYIATGKGEPGISGVQYARINASSGRVFSGLRGTQHQKDCSFNKM